ncbi:type II secretion system F family protein [Acutalibacter intestini]|uniref:type II secretion system F family protein n=1 Tax=Acutalibacter intestini TaxID=3093659 RepID=UPI002AC8A7C7|nr:type II secretion system F family protein [Acutalibacter sp. M00204]
MKKDLTNQSIAALCLELAMLMHAGVGTGDGLALMAQEDQANEKMLNGMALRLDEGGTLSDAMKEAGGFPAYVCGLVQVGEQSGKLEEALRALSTFYEDRARLDRRVRSALLYPAVMLALMLVVITVLLVKVLPIFDEVYASLGGRLSGVAGGLLSIGRWLDGAMPVLLAVLALVVIFFILFAAVGSFRERVTGWWKKTRGDKGVSRRMNTARVAQALAMGMASGLPMEDALDLARDVMAGTPTAQQRCQDCRARLDEGEALSSAMRESGLLPAAQCRLLELGQRSGAGDAAMEKIAQDLAEESEAALEEKVSRAEPALVLVCSMLVGLILLSVMLPLMNIMAAIG